MLGGAASLGIGGRGLLIDGLLLGFAARLLCGLLFNGGMRNRLLLRFRFRCGLFVLLGLLRLRLLEMIVR